MKGRQAAGIDVYVGQRLRLARNLAGLTQQGLAAKLGISFQQVQKYESGANRLAVGTLFEISLLLDQPLAYFLPPKEGEPAREDDARESFATVRFAATREGAELVDAYRSIPKPAVRRNLIEMMRALSRDES